jgi:hypothetical protein
MDSRLSKRTSDSLAFTTLRWRNKTMGKFSGSICRELTQCALTTSMKTAQNKLIRTLGSAGTILILVWTILLEARAQDVRSLQLITLS